MAVNVYQFLQEHESLSLKLTESWWEWQYLNKPVNKFYFTANREALQVKARKYLVACLMAQFGIKTAVLTSKLSGKCEP